MKLVIGAGDRRVEGFKHHDIQDLPGLDYVCDFWDLGEQIELGTVEEIHMTHVLEHFPAAETERVLRTLYEMLSDEGKLYIEVPNLRWHAIELIKDPLNKQIVEYMYGGQLNEWDYHYTGFTPDLLEKALSEAGFTITSLAPNSSIECWAVKA